MFDPAEEFEGMKDELIDNGGKPRSRSQVRRASYDGPRALRIGAIRDATMFHLDRELWGLGVLTEFMADEAADVLMASAKVTSREYPMANWPAAFIGSVLTGDRSWLRFHNEETARRVFALCGFGDWFPSYDEMYKKFVELESHWEAFVDALATIVQRALRFCPEIGQCGFVDSSHASSRSRIHHACLDEAKCKAVSVEAKKNGRQPVGERTKIHAVAVAAVIEQQRAAEAENELPDDAADGGIVRTRGPLVAARRPSGSEILLRALHSQGHEWLTFDLTSGLRRYEGGASWFGILTPTFIPTPVGLPPLAVYPIPADFPEWQAWPRLLDLVDSVLGRQPQLISVDRGFGWSGFYRFNSYRGIATVGPRRTRTGTKADDRITWRLKGDDVDEDGIARCVGCGGPTRHHGIYKGTARATPVSLGPYFDEKGEPRIRVACLDPMSDRCEPVQSIACERDWVWVVPLARLHPLYNDVRFIHHNREGNFRYGRDRYNAAGKDASQQLLRPGLPAHRLRLWAALVLDWFRVSLRHAWIEAKTLDVAVNPDTVVDLSGVGAAKLAERESRRRQLHTTLPYGAYWNRFTREHKWAA